jgi:hypothetical protein
MSTYVKTLVASSGVVIAGSRWPRHGSVPAAAVSASRLLALAATRTPCSCSALPVA